MAMKAALPCAALAAALTYAVAATAQTSAPPTPPQPEQAPAARPEAAKPAAAPAPEAAKAKPARPAGRPEDERNVAAVAAVPPVDPATAQAECAWVGKRVVGLLVRDDVDTATDFTRFYAMFHCPDAHIGATLACVVSDPGASREGAALSEHVDLCWANPSTRLLPQKPPNPDKPAPTAK